MWSPVPAYLRVRAYLFTESVSPSIFVTPQGPTLLWGPAQKLQGTTYKHTATCTQNSCWGHPPQFSPDMWILSPAIGSKDKIMNCFDECFHPLRNSQSLPPFTLKSQTSLPWLTRLYVFRIPFLIWSLMICPSHTFCIFFELTSRDSGWGILHSQFYFLWILLPHTSVQVSHSDPHFIGRPLLTKLLKSRPLYTLLYLLSKSVYLLSIFSCQNHISPRPEMIVYSNWCQ